MYPSLSRSRRKEKGGRHGEFASDRIPAKPARRSETVQFARGRNESDVTYGVCLLEENSLSVGFRQQSSKRASGTPIKALIDEEVSKEMETKRTSPSLVARLMGLDTLPAQAVVKHEKHASQNLYPDESQEYKDVFEVMEASKLKTHRNQSTRKGLLRSKRTETDIDLIRQKFMDAKRLSAHEALQSSKELKDALEILDSNKDLLLEFLQDPNSLFTKQLRDLNHRLPSPLPGQITILKSSKDGKFGGNEVWSRPEDDRGKSSHMQKYAPKHVNNSLKEQNISHRQKSSVSRFMNNTETRSHATRIVVLKPSLEKTQKMEGAVSFGYENFHFGSRKQEFMMSVAKELHKEGRERQEFSTNLEYSVGKAKGSREIAREITQQMQQKVTTFSKSTNIMELNAYLQNESSLSDFTKLNKSETFCKLPDPFDEWCNGLSPSSSCSTESLMNREAKKRLSDRWKMTYRLQEMGLIDRGSNTLGEMLALSDIDMPRPSATVDYAGKRKVSDVKISKNEPIGACGYPLGISSKDGWKDGNSGNLLRSKSLPTFSSASESRRSSKLKNRGGNNSHCMLPSKNNYCMLKDVLQMGPEDFPEGTCSMQKRSLVQNFPNYPKQFKVLNPTREETVVPEREIHVHSEESMKTVHMGHFSEAKPLHSVPVNEALVDRKHEDETDSIPQWEYEICSSNSPREQVKQLFLVPMENEELLGKNHNDVVVQEASIHCPHVDPVLYQPEADEFHPSLCSKECELPSPVSVLEPPSEEESSASGCFERISADLQELRMQLKLLKLESGGNADDLDISAASDEDCAVDGHLYLPAGQMIQEFRSVDDRDFSYVLDMLIDSGIHGANQERLPECCQSPSCPVDQHVFIKLEKKYCAITSWSRSERKLLFDLTNCILSSTVKPCMDLHPWVMSKRCGHASDHDDLVEGLWQMVVKQRENIGNGPENVLDPRWLCLEDEVQFIGEEIEKMLNDDLLEELIADFSGNVAYAKDILYKYECASTREVLVH